MSTGSPTKTNCDPQHTVMLLLWKLASDRCGCSASADGERTWRHSALILYTGPNFVVHSNSYLCLKAQRDKADGMRTWPCSREKGRQNHAPVVRHQLWGMTENQTCDWRTRYLPEQVPLPQCGQKNWQQDGSKRRKRQRYKHV
jgi:hypothetical protein